MPSQIADYGQDGLLQCLTAPERPLLTRKTIVIVAHPDEETLACGAVLPRLTDLTIVHVTDGAPRAPDDARRRGFGHWAEYARARRRELESAATIAGVPAPALKSLGLPEQTAALRLATLTRAVLGFIAGADLVLTHAFEGAHPDLDAVAFAVAAACGRMRGRRPAVIEMPLYLLGDAGEGAARLRLTSTERARKARMLAQFVTQQEMLLAFGVRDEVYRIAPERDFTRPPEGARYRRLDGAISGSRFAQLARDARGELGLDAARA